MVISSAFDSAPVTELTAVGDQGWELVSVVGAGASTLWAFKRRK